MGGEKEELGKENNHCILYSFEFSREGDAIQYFLILPVLDLDAIFLCPFFYSYNDLCFVFLSHLTSCFLRGVNNNPPFMALFQGSLDQ